MRAWMRELTALLQNAQKAEEAVTTAYISLNFEPWDEDGKRRAVLYRRDRFDVSVVELRCSAPATEAHIRVVIRDWVAGQVVTERRCADLEEAAEAYNRLRYALIEAFMP